MGFLPSGSPITGSGMVSHGEPLGVNVWHGERVASYGRDRVITSGSHGQNKCPRLSLLLSSSFLFVPFLLLAPFPIQLSEAR